MKKTLLAITIIATAIVTPIAEASTMAFSYWNWAVSFSDDSAFLSKLKIIAESPIGIDSEEPVHVQIQIWKCSGGRKACYSSYKYQWKRTSTITIDRTVDSDDVIMKAFVHEMWHARFALLTDRQQEAFSSISHDKAKKWNLYPDSKPYEDFASGYGATKDPVIGRYEDFAEAFTMYVFHNSEFKEAIKTNEKMKKKYIFMKSTVFRGKFLSGTCFTVGTFPEKRWDMTKAPIDSAFFLKFLTYSRK